MIWDGEAQRRPVDEVYDFVVVGSGAAGATAAVTLAESGASVAVVEEGPAVRTAELGDRLYDALRRLFRDMGANVARGRALIPVLQGRCLGGSTVVNSAIVWRIPDDVWAPWRDTFGLGDALPLDALHRAWDRIEADLNVHPVDVAVRGGNNRLMDEARQRLGVEASPIRRYERGCRGTARCLTGCPHGAKQSMLVSYLPRAEAAGAHLYTSARVDRITTSGGRASAVVGRFRETDARARPVAPFTLRARRGVVVAGSAIQTPGILARSGVRNAHLGYHFQGHPGCAILGVFDQDVNMWSGATQGFDADHHRRDLRFKIETIAFPPEILLSRLPGVGREWVEAMRHSRNLAAWAVQLRAFGQGRVAERFFGTDITFDFTPEDMANLRRGVAFTAELMFAAGAREVWPGIYGVAPRLRSPDDIRLVREGPTDPRAYQFIVSHLFGTARMGRTARDGVVGPDFAVHGLPGLYVTDSSVFPTNLGVNPQHAIMGTSMLAAHRILGAAL